MSADLYDVLGTSTDASAEEIKHAYRERVREYHPDVNDHPAGDSQFKLIRTAHDVLSDPAERKDYDRLGHREYVDNRLDDLPPISVFPEEALPEGVTTESEATDDPSGATTSTQRRNRGESTASTAASTEEQQHTRSSQTQRTSSQSTNTADQSSRKARQGSTTSAESGTTSATASQTDSTTTNNGNGYTTSAGSKQSSWDAATNPQQSTTSSTTSAGVRRRRGLKRWYGVVALSLLLYLGGLAVYMLPRGSALSEFGTTLTTEPVSALFGAFPLSSPTVYLRSTVRGVTAGSPDMGLLLLIGAVLLPLVVLTTVGRFGRGGAWMYALPSLAPAVCFAAWPFVTIPTVVALLGLVLLPILSGAGFLVDVGRYLRATR